MPSSPFLSTPPALRAANDNPSPGPEEHVALSPAATCAPAPVPGQLTLHAVNDNPGGPTSASLVLTGLVSVMARAYVAQLIDDAR
jgi:hypothetical protein